MPYTALQGLVMQSFSVTEWLSRNSPQSTGNVVPSR
jgi:hypothetical protein